MAQVTTIELTMMINTLQEKNDENTVNEALNIFLKLIDNIIKSPSEEKFKVIKKNNKTVQEKWLKCEGITEIAQAVGYEEVDEIVMSFTGEVENLVNLKQSIQAYLSEKQVRPAHHESKSGVSSHSHLDSGHSVSATPDLSQKPAEKTEASPKEPQNSETKNHEKTSKGEIKTKKPEPETKKPETRAKPVEIKQVHLAEPNYQLEWSGSSYVGPMQDGWFEGHGKFAFPSGVIYDGEFHKGEFHGKGTLIFPNGGKYKATWNRGKAVDGEYEYYDGLIYDSQNWNYCQIPDRRFYTEIKEGLRPAGATLMVNDARGPKNMAPGTYDVGEGYYDRNKNMVYSYEGEEKYVPEDMDISDIIDKYRYNPSNS